jgi:hypothetical protein
VRGHVEFAVRVPVDDAGLRANVAHALSRDLLHLVGQPAERHTDRLSIIANGPSAVGAPHRSPTMAINGSIRLFNRADPPSYWVGCDPQELLADLLDYAPDETIYLVASKCHPKVFERLRGRRVLLWHVDDHATWDLVKPFEPVRSASSVTICAFEIGERLGYDRFGIWGWDGCYLDGRDHANGQAHGGIDIENDVGGQIFPTTRTWCLEAQDAVNKLRMTPRDIQIHGPGMIGAVLDYLDVKH